MADSLNDSISQLGSDLFAQKMYYVATSALWTYDYFLTLGDEIAYAYSGRKTYVFYLFLANRYIAPCVILLTLLSYFLPSWTLAVYVQSSSKCPSILTRRTRCTRYGFMETFETTLLTTIAEIFMTIRVYAVTGKHKLVLVFTTVVLLWQWAIAVYVMSQSSKGTSSPALLLSRRDSSPPPLPTLPNIDPFHICIFEGPLFTAPWVEAFLCISLAFDVVAFLVIFVTTTRSIRNSHPGRMLRVIQQDGIIYFFMLFTSNLVWLLLVLHARPGLKFIQNQSAMIISSIMVNRITLSLKRTSHTQDVIPWSMKTFEDRSSSSHRTPAVFSDNVHELDDLQAVRADPFSVRR